mgnify:CR=1 FL=1
MSAAAFQFHDALGTAIDMRAEVVRGLKSQPRAIAPKFFYDERGSELFDAICELPEYYLTRAENEVLVRRAADIARLVGPGAVLVEFGSGATEKVRRLLEALRPAGYLGIDISREFLTAATARLARDCPWLPVHAACADFSQPLALRYPPPGSTRLVFFPGSSIGNFTPAGAVDFLAHQRELVGADGGFVIGVDLKKDERVLHAAYNDAAGVTAAFNRNLLVRMQRELNADLDVDGFEHDAVYDAAAGCIDMYLVSQRAQSIRIDDHEFTFAAGERLHTESSYKYTIAEFQGLAQRAGYEPVAVWTDAAERFSVHYLRPALASVHVADHHARGVTRGAYQG